MGPGDFRRDPDNDRSSLLAANTAIPAPHNGMVRRRESQSV
jgi:hypothetical protein